MFVADTGRGVVPPEYLLAEINDTNVEPTPGYTLA